MPPSNVKQAITRVQAEKQPYIGLADRNGRYEKVIFPSEVEVGLAGVPASLTLGGELNVSYSELDLRGKTTGNISPDEVIVSILHDSAITVRLPQPAKIGKYLTIKDGSFNVVENEYTITITTADGGTRTSIDGYQNVYITGDGVSITFFATSDGWSQISTISPTLSASPNISGLVFQNNSDEPLPDAMSIGAGIGMVASIEDIPGSVFVGSNGVKNGIKNGGNGAITKKVMIQPDFDIIADRRGTGFYGDVTFQKGMSGSLQKLCDGKPYLIAGDNISILTNSFGQVQISAVPWDDPDDGYAPIAAPFLLASENPFFPNAITLNAGEGIYLGLSGSLLNISSEVNLGMVEDLDSRISDIDSQVQRWSQAPVITTSPEPSLSGSFLLTAGAGVLLTQTGSNFVISVTAPSVVGVRTGVLLTGSAGVYMTPEKFSYVAGSIGASVYVNGVRMYEELDYNVSESVEGTGYDTITFMPEVIPEDQSRVQADYVIDLAIGTAQRWRSNIVPVGDIDGINDTFKLPNNEAFAYTAGLLSVDVYLNGVRQFLGEDYDISASSMNGYDTFTMKKAPMTSDRLIIDYVLPN